MLIKSDNYLSLQQPLERSGDISKIRTYVDTLLITHPIHFGALLLCRMLMCFNDIQTSS